MSSPSREILRQTLQDIKSAITDPPLIEQAGKIVSGVMTMSLAEGTVPFLVTGAVIYIDGVYGQFIRKNKPL